MWSHVDIEFVSGNAAASDGELFTLFCWNYVQKGDELTLFQYVYFHLFITPNIV